MYWLELAAKRSKIAMASGAEPHCLVDEWVRLLEEPTHKGRKDYTDREMALVVFSFLFASQDAMSSGLIYAFQHLADHPDIMAKVKEEQERVRKGSYNSPITIELLDQMPYLQAFVKESLRVMPPVVMVCGFSFRRVHREIETIVLGAIQDHQGIPNQRGLLHSC
jgi:C-22 sterol desaturase